jgi:hypothetical protein
MQRTTRGTKQIQLNQCSSSGGCNNKADAAEANAIAAAASDATTKQTQPAMQQLLAAEVTNRLVPI